MCTKCDTLEADIQTEILFAGIERELILAESGAGESVPGAIRPLSAAEKRAKMRFGEIEALEQKAADEAAKLLASNAQVYIMAVISAIFGTESAVAPGQVVDAIEQVNRAQPKAVIAETARSQKAMSAILANVFAGAAQIVTGEARRQGVKKTPPPLVADAGRFDDLARAVALHPWTRITGKLQADMLEPRTLALPSVAKADVQTSLEQIPLDGATDLARQTIHAAHGAGRVEQAETMQPEEIYSSELMDGATCSACFAVDGKDYTSMADAKTEYESGGYGACKGGARCRGTLVFQYNALGTDAPPPAPEPAPTPEPPAPVAPKTPRKRTPKAPAPVAPAAPAPAPSVPGMPPAPTGTPPKRKKAVSQRYTALDQLPIDHGKAGDPPLLIARDTNPGYGDGTDKNYSNNCSSVVQAYEMQRRGYDVRAAPVKAGRGRYDSQYNGEWWNDADGNPVKPTYVDTLDLPAGISRTRPPAADVVAKAKLDAYIGKMPDGARGFVALHWTKGGGHVFSFEKVNGKPVYLEGQTGVVDGERHLAPGKFAPKSLRVTRIDDKIPNDAITEALETRPEGLAAEIAGKAPTVAQMKAQSQYRARLNPDGTRTLLLPKYRVNPFTRKWEEVPPDVLKQAQDEFDRTEKKRLGK